MDKECPHCHALKFKNEPAGMCCASGKVQLPEIKTPPEPGNYLYGKTTFAGSAKMPRIQKAILIYLLPTPLKIVCITNPYRLSQKKVLKKRNT
ncbi:ATP-dependent DNA helicase [Aphis craccivora]|uniref:ATP-dependent DNA helicase n=1 Tax=Aphis craccivora TaxID=307492 RepID=A0A6G0YH40_APHCR|nr:ATP-dependent DNA helicase [Aphis craccivora]